MRKFSVFLVFGVILISLVYGLELVTTESHLDKVLLGPSLQNWMGTDDLGRDYMARCFRGLFISFCVGFFASFISLFIGGFLGFLSGYISRLDLFLMRFFELISILPSLILVTFLYLLLDLYFPQFQSNRIFLLSIAIGVSYWSFFARFVRTQVLQLSQEEFVEGAVAIGASTWRIFYKHMLPHLRPVLFRYYLSCLPSFFLFESFMSFLGFGLQSPQVSLGTLLNEGWRHFAVANHLLLAPGLLLFLVLFWFQVYAGTYFKFEGKIKNVEREDIA